MEIENVCNLIDDLNFEEDKNNYLLKYNEIKKNIEIIDNVLNNNNEENIKSLNFEEIVNIIKNINIYEIKDIETLKYYKSLLDRYEKLKKNEELKLTNI
jgi:hypothetical protein